MPFAIFVLREALRGGERLVHAALGDEGAHQVLRERAVVHVRSLLDARARHGLGALGDIAPLHQKRRPLPYLLDVGGESTRPGAAAVSVSEELDRVVPVIRAIRAAHDVAISVDTSKPEVMREAVAAGAGLINDVCALEAPGALQAAASCGVPVCLMHMQGTPRTMQSDPQYADVVTDIKDYLAARVTACVEAGIPRERLVHDPGFGFGKLLAHNLRLLAHLDSLQMLGLPLLVGISRKSMLGQVTGRDVNGRLAGSVAAAMLALERGARILRVHDVAETVDAVRLWTAMREHL